LVSLGWMALLHDVQAVSHRVGGRRVRATAGHCPLPREAALCVQSRAQNLGMHPFPEPRWPVHARITLHTPL